jgi:ABC-type dipeptide/oligopeptide/nickel transport system ATPase subunit
MFVPASVHKHGTKLAGHEFPPFLNFGSMYFIESFSATFKLVYSIMPPTRKRPEKASKATKKPKDGAAPPPDAQVDDNAEMSAADKLRNMGVVTTCALNSKIMHRNVRDINVSNLTVTFHGTPLIEEAELTLNYGNRYGYIGRNGCGKSTFMKVIAARSFPIPEGIDIFHLSEEIEASDMTAKEAVMSVDAERAKLEEEAELLNDMMANEDGGESADDTLERLTQVYERLEELDAATAETRASKILAGLGFTPEKQNKKTREFSGGWRMRIALARALFIQPTLLLLDEPTNHLGMSFVLYSSSVFLFFDFLLVVNLQLFRYGSSGLAGGLPQQVGQNPFYGVSLTRFYEQCLHAHCAPYNKEAQLLFR